MKMQYVLLILLGIFLFTACTSQPTPAGQQSQNMLYVTISDPGMTLDGVTSIKLTVSGISIHNQDSDAWISLTAAEQTVDLMQLKEQQVKELLASANLSDGRYNQVRLDIKKVMVTLNGTEQEAKLPSSTLKINIDLSMVNSTAVLNFDVMANASLHTTGNGVLIMAPVINVETYKDAKVEKTGRNLEVKEQKTKTSEEVGMDEKGNVGKGIKINPETRLEMEPDGKISRNFEETASVGTGKAIFTVKDKNNASGRPDNETDNRTGKPDNATDNGRPENKSIKTAAGLTVAELNVTIKSLQVHAAGDNSSDNSSSWITITNESKTFSLLDLQDAEALLGEADLPVGKYTQIRMDMEKAAGIINNVSVNLTVPSRTLRIVGVLNVEANTTSLATIDFQVDKSVVKAGTKYLLKPVIRLTTRTGVQVTARTRDKDMEKISHEGGKVDEDREIDAAE